MLPKVQISLLAVIVGLMLTSSNLTSQGLDILASEGTPSAEATCQGEPRDPESVLALIREKEETSNWSYSRSSGTIVASDPPSPFSVTVDGKAWIVDGQLAPSPNLLTPSDPSILLGIEKTFDKIEPCSGVVEYLIRAAYVTDAGLEQDLLLPQFSPYGLYLTIEQYPAHDDGKPGTERNEVIDVRMVSDGRVAAFVRSVWDRFSGEKLIVEIAYVFKFEDGFWKIDWLLPINAELADTEVE